MSTELNSLLRDVLEALKAKGMSGPLVDRIRTASAATKGEQQ